MNRFERCFFWFILSCILSLFTTHSAFSNRREVINTGCRNISSEFNGTNVFDSQAQISRFDVIGSEKNSANGEEYSINACQKTFEKLKTKHFAAQWGLNASIYWIIFSVGFYASENKKKTGF